MLERTPKAATGDDSGFDRSVPYNGLKPLPPAKVVETVPVLKAVITAREQLTALNTACRLIPNPWLITSTIPLREARASSEIENIVTTNDELFRAAWKVDPDPSPQTKEALRYNDALHAAMDSLDRLPVSMRTAVEICSILQTTRAEIRSGTGTYIGNPVTGGRVYTPPEGRDVIEEHLRGWESFLYSDHGLDPLVAIALAHYQFEAIHPFYDGNGRTGRILNLALLVQEKLLTQPVLYLSGRIVDTKSDYYRRLRAVTEEGDWQGWILYLVNSIEGAAREATALIDAVSASRDELVETIRARTNIASAQEFAEVLVVNPYVRINDVTKAGLAQRQTASRWLHELERLGVLELIEVGRERIFVNRRVLDVLTA